MPDLWLENGIKSTSTGLTIAPANFRLTQPVADFGAGLVLHRGKALFTYAEFKFLQKQDLIPKGWRLPTAEEVAKLITEFTEDGATTSFDFAKKLRLDFDGYVYPYMKAYNRDPVGYENIFQRHLEGRFWVENYSEGLLLALYVSREEPPKLQTFCTEGDASIRLVYN